MAEKPSFSFKTNVDYWQAANKELGISPQMLELLQQGINLLQEVYNEGLPKLPKQSTDNPLLNEGFLQRLKATYGTVDDLLPLTREEILSGTMPREWTLYTQSPDNNDRVAQRVLLRISNTGNDKSLGFNVVKFVKLWRTNEKGKIHKINSSEFEVYQEYDGIYPNDSLELTPEDGTPEEFVTDILKQLQLSRESNSLQTRISPGDWRWFSFPNLQQVKQL